MDSAGKAFAGVVGAGAMITLGGYVVAAAALAFLGAAAVLLLAAAAVLALIIATGYAAFRNPPGLVALVAVVVSGLVGFGLPLVFGQAIMAPAQAVFETNNWTRIVPFIVVFLICQWVLPFVVMGGTALVMIDGRPKASHVSALVLLAPLAILPWGAVHASNIQYWSPGARGAVAEAGELSITSARIRESPGPTAEMYLTITNDGDEPDMLVGIVAESAPVVQLHETIDANGSALMQELWGINVPAGTTVTLEPEGTHAMLMMVEEVLVGEEVPVTLTFEHAGDVSLGVPVVSIAEVESSVGEHA